MLTVSAVFSDIAREHVDFGTGSDFSAAARRMIDSMATGVQYMPRVAKVAYALAIVSGDISWVPSAIDGTWCDLLAVGPLDAHLLRPSASPGRCRCR